jgi:hypothetical protein
MLTPYFVIGKKRGILYTFPYLEKIGLQCVIKFSNTISEFIENNNLLPDWGLYQCLLGHPIDNNLLD